MSTLGELLNENEMIMREIEDLMGEVTPEAEKAIANVYEKILQKVDNSQTVRLQLKKKHEALMDLSRFYAACAKQINARIDGFENYVINQMLEKNLTELSGKTITIKLRRNRPSVEVDIDAKHLPENLRRVKYDPDKEAIREEISKGHVVDGCYLKEGYGLTWKAKLR